MCKALGIPCQILEKYCANREKFFQDNGVTKIIGKVAFLSVMNGGSKDYQAIENPTDDLKQFYESEIPQIHDQVAFRFQKKFNKHKEKREKKDIEYNHKASFMNIILCDLENKALMAMWEFFGKPDDAVLCFDGIMLAGCATNFNIKACEEFVLARTHIPIRLDIKPFTEVLDLKVEIACAHIPKYPELSLTYYLDFENLVDKDVYLEWVDEWRDNGLAYINNYGKAFFITINKRVDPDTGLIQVFNEKVKRDDIFNNIDVDCRIINQKYDRETYTKHQSLSQNKQRVKLQTASPAHKSKLHKYHFDTLGLGTKNTPGFMRTSLKKRWLRTYDGLTFYPYLALLGQPKRTNMFNTFAGFPLEDVATEGIIDFTQSRLYKHVREEMMSTDDEFEHFLDHLADLIQDPAHIKTNAHLFYSRQGMGKGMLAQFASNLLGQEHVISLINTDAYFGNFNYAQSEKLLKIFEEISDKGTAFHNHDRLKGEQAMDLERVEQKNLPVYHIRHCARFWYFTNNENALYIECDDRRFTCHRANNRYANNFEYFRGIWAEVRDINFCCNAFQFFAQRKYSMESAYVCHDTDFKKEQKLNCLSHGLKFLKELIEHDFGGMQRDGDRFRAVDVSRQYRDYCTENGIKFNVSTLKTQLLKLSISDRAMLFKGKKTKCYILSALDVLTLFKIFLKDDRFQFEKGCDAPGLEEPIV